MKLRPEIFAWKIITVNYTWLLLFKNHFFNPQTGSTISQGFRLQMSGWPSFASMRWRQSLCVQVVFMWSEHARRISSVPWWQLGHATHSLYCSPLRYGISCDKFFRVSSRNSRTRVASSTEFCPSTWWLCAFLCLKVTFTNPVLHMRTKSWISFPMMNHAPFWYRVGWCVAHVFEHQWMDRETSCKKRPWGTKPWTKRRYNGHGSVDDGVILQSPTGDAFNWPGTKYFSSVEETENLAIKPNRSIMSKMSSLIIPCPMKLENTWSTCSMLRMPLPSSSRQYLAYKGIYIIYK